MHAGDKVSGRKRHWRDGWSGFLCSVLLLAASLGVPVPAWAAAFSVSNGAWPANVPSLPPAGLGDTEGAASVNVTLGGVAFVVATNGPARLTRDDSYCFGPLGSICIDPAGWFDVNQVTLKRVDSAAFAVSSIEINANNAVSDTWVRFYKSGSQVGNAIFIAGGSSNFGLVSGAPLAVDEIRLVSSGGPLAGVDIVGLSGDSSVAAAPTVTNLSPWRGPTGGGTTVTIIGTGFAAIPGTGAVKFGGTVATYTINSDTQITATAPAGSAGTVDVTVTSPGGTSATSAADQYTYVAVPTVIGVYSPTSSGVYKAGAVVIVRVVFDDVINVTGVPTLTLETGAIDRDAIYVSKGGNYLDFQYTVQSGDQSADLDYTSITALALNGGSIRNTVNDDAILTLPAPGTGSSFGASSNFVIDTLAPSVASIVPDSGATAAATSVNFTVTFGEPVTGVDANDFALTSTGTAVGSIAGVSTSNNLTYTVTVNNVTGNGTLRLDLNASGTGIQDAAGNAVSGGFTSGTMHTVAMATVPGAPTIATATPGNGHASAYFVVPASDGGSVITSYTATSSPGGITSSGCTISPCVVYGLTNGTAYTFTVVATNAVGTGAASAASNSVTPKGDQTITFSNPGTQNFGTTPTLTATASSASPVSFSSSTTGTCIITSGGALTFLSAGTCTINADQSGNGAYFAASTVSQSFTVAAVVPGAPTIGTATAGNAQAMVSFTAPASGGGTAITGYTVTSSPGGNVATGSASPITITGLTNGIAYTFTVTATNSMGTGMASSPSASVTPGTAPVVTSVAVPANGRYVAGQNLDFTVNWDQAVIVTPPAQISLVIGSATVVADYLSGSGTSATTFRHTVQAGEVDNDGIAVGALASPGGPIRAAVSGIDATMLTLNSVGSTAGVLVGAPTLVLIPPSLPGAMAGVAYNQTLGTLGGTAPYSYAVTAGTLPAGLTLSAGGVLSGTPTAAGMFNVMITATDSNAYTGSQAYALLVLPPMLALTPAAATLPAATASSAYSQSFAATGGTAPYSYAVTAGALPAGLSLNPATGALSGTPTAAGTFNVTITATDSSTGVGAPFTVSKAYALQVQPPSLTVGPVSMAVGYGASATPVTLSISGTATAVAIATAPAHGTAVASGTAITYTPAPGYAGADSFSYTASDAYTTSAPATVSVTVAAPTLALTPSSLPAATASNSYSQLLSTSGGTAPYSYAVTAGALPAGLSLNPATGALSGTPTVAGTVNVTITATDSSTGVGAPFTISRAYALQVGQPTLVFEQTGTGLPASSADQDYGQTLAVHGGVAPYRFSVVAGALPAGLALAESGQISGKPTAAGAYGFTVQVTDANGFSGTQAYSLAVEAVAQVIRTFAATPAKPVFAEGGSFEVSATGGASGNPVVFASLAPSVCRVQGGTVTLLSAGVCSLSADQAGNAMYLAAAQVRLDVDVSVATPALAWLSGLGKTYGEADFDLPDPRSDSAGAFTFSSSNPAVAKVSGRTVTLVGAGTAMLVATQAAAGNYAAATVEVQLVVGTRPDPTHDSQVTGELQAQVDAGVRFAQAQQSNIRDRLRMLRSGQNASSANLTLGYAGGSLSQPGLSLPVGNMAAAALPSMPAGWGVWLSGTATFGKAGRNGREGGGFDFNTGGITMGVDHVFGEHLLAGIAAGWGSQGTDFDGTSSKVDADQRSLAVYGLWRQGEHLFLDGMLGAGRLDFDLTRWSAAAAANALGNRQGRQWYGALTFGYEHRDPTGLTLTGYGRFDGYRTDLDAYRERGLDELDLAYGRQRVDNSSLAVGLEGERSFKRLNSVLRPFWNVEYRKALENRGDVAINYVQRPLDNGYALRMNSYNDDTLSLGFGVDLQLDSGWLFSLKLGREQGRNALTSNSIGVLLRYGSSSGRMMQALGATGTERSDPFAARCLRRDVDCHANGVAYP